MSNEALSAPAAARIGPPAWLRRVSSNFLVRRLAKAAFTIWLVTTLIFFIIRAMPGSPVDIFVLDLMQTGLSQEEAYDRAASLLGLPLDQPLPEQYRQFVLNLLHGDLGKSYRSPGVPVSEMIANRLPWTVFSIGTALFLSFLLGMLLGMVVAYKRNSWLDHLFTNLAAALDALPPYLVALVLIIFLGVVWRIVPVPAMRGSLSPGMKPGFTLEFFADALKHLAIPAFVYVLSTFGSWMLTMKSSTISTLGEDYVTVAKARGLPDRRIITAYVGRNASLPLVTRLAISVATSLGGSVVIENLFVYQGIGLLLYQALYGRDYPVMQGVFLVTTVAVVLANSLADILYGWLDPRIRVVGGGN